MTRLLILATIAVGTVLLAAQTAAADCGQIVIVSTDNDGSGSGSGSGQGSTQGSTQGSGSASGDTTTEDDIPSPFGSDEVQIGEPRARSFYEPAQRAVIAWNGKEEILVLSTNQKSVKGKGAVLSVLPLPGKPIDVTKGDLDLFKNARRTLGIRKPQAVDPILEKKIGAHNIFVVKAKDTNEFADDVQEYIKEKYGNKAKAAITKMTKRVIGSYLKAGFEYFAFDLMTSDTELSTKQAICYRFESDKIYYPLVISRCGGTGPTTIELMVFSPGLVDHFKGLPEKEIGSTSSVTVSKSKLNALDSEIADLFEDEKVVMARIWTIRGQLDNFPGDVLAWSE